MSLTNEDFNTLLNEVRTLVASGTEQFTFSERQHDKSGFWFYTGRLESTSSREVHIDAAQMNQLMDEIFKGRFTSIDLSKQHDLDSDIMGVALEKIYQHFSSVNPDKNRPPLLELKLANNQLDLQVEPLAKLLRDSACQMKVLDLSHAELLESELVYLAKTIENHPTLESVSLRTGGISLYKYYKDNSHLYNSTQSSIAIANILQNNAAIKSFDLQISQDAKDENFLPVIQALQQDRLQSLALDMNNHYNLNESLHGLSSYFKNVTQLKKLRLYSRGNTAGGCHDMIFTALQNENLTDLQCDSICLGNIDKDHSFPLNINSQLTHIVFRRCGLDRGGDNSLLRILKLLPLKKLDLSCNGLHGDVSGLALVELIHAKSDTLEELNLSGNRLGWNRDWQEYEKHSDILPQLAEAIAKCQKLRVLDFTLDDNFHWHDKVKFMRQLKMNNPNLEKVNCLEAPEKIYGFEDLVEEYATFLQKEMQVKKAQGMIIPQPKLLTASDAQFSRLPEFSALEKLYQKEIEILLKRIARQLDRKQNGNNFDKMLGKKPDTSHLHWNHEHAEIFQYVQNGEYAEFHQKWNQWKKDNGDTEKTVDIELSIFLDFVDETLTLYAESIQPTDLPEYAWTKSFQSVSMGSLRYETKLDCYFKKREQERSAAQDKWHAECEERRAQERAAEEAAKAAAVLQEAEIHIMTDIDESDISDEESAGIRRSM